jgi:hypothetical protein
MEKEENGDGAAGGGQRGFIIYFCVEGKGFLYLRQSARVGVGYLYSLLEFICWNRCWVWLGMLCIAVCFKAWGWVACSKSFRGVRRANEEYDTFSWEPCLCFKG